MLHLAKVFLCPAPLASTCKLRPAPLHWCWAPPPPGWIGRWVEVWLVDFLLLADSEMSQNGVLQGWGGLRQLGTYWVQSQPHCHHVKPPREIHNEMRINFCEDFLKSKLSCICGELEKREPWSSRTDRFLHSQQQWVCGGYAVCQSLWALANPSLCQMLKPGLLQGLRERSFA